MQTAEEIYAELESRAGLTPGSLRAGPMAFLAEAGPARLAQVPEEDLETLKRQFLKALPTEREFGLEDGLDPELAREAPPHGDTAIRTALLLVGRELVQADTEALSPPTRELLLDICPFCQGDADMPEG